MKILVQKENFSIDDLQKIKKFILTESERSKNLMGINESIIDSYLFKNDNEYDFWLLKNKITVVGLLVFQKSHSDYGDIFINLIYIRKRYRQKDNGYLLLTELKKISNKLTCNVNEGNNNMYKLLKKLNMVGLESIITDCEPYIWYTVT